MDSCSFGGGGGNAAAARPSLAAGLQMSNASVWVARQRVNVGKVHEGHEVAHQQRQSGYKGDKLCSAVATAGAAALHTSSDGPHLDLVDSESIAVAALVRPLTVHFRSLLFAFAASACNYKPNAFA